MGAAYFYHLTRKPLADTLRTLLGRSLENGWRVAVRGTDRAGLEALDGALWLGEQAAFLPHGLTGGDHDADQPVLLGVEGEMANDPQCLMSVQGALVSAEEVGRYERVCVLFDGADENALQGARNQWRMLKEAGASAQYWSEESGRWEKKAET
ncbi:MAG: DNA polymerase III subunit chi [Sulfitobacter sp.]|nr:DNA polymerase III subunit chi [Sulfitobacter sp.]